MVKAIPFCPQDHSALRSHPYNLVLKQEGSTGEEPAALERQRVAASIHHFAVTLPSFGLT